VADLSGICNRKDLGVDIKNSRGNNKNTRSLGKDIITELKTQNKEHLPESEM
jgi:hypothetical protein